MGLRVQLLGACAGLASADRPSSSHHPDPPPPPHPLPLPVILVLEHDDVGGSSGLVLNMPTPLLIANLGLEEDIAGAAGGRRGSSTSLLADARLVG